LVLVADTASSSTGLGSESEASSSLALFIFLISASGHKPLFNKRDVANSTGLIVALEVSVIGRFRGGASSGADTTLSESAILLRGSLSVGGLLFTVRLLRGTIKDSGSESDCSSFREEGQELLLWQSIFMVVSVPEIKVYGTADVVNLGQIRNLAQCIGSFEGLAYSRDTLDSGRTQHCM
jgi:hypothetical protein